MKNLSGHSSKEISESHFSSENDAIIELEKALDTMQSDISELKNSLHAITQNHTEKENDSSGWKVQKNSLESLFLTVLGVIIAVTIVKLLF